MKGNNMKVYVGMGLTQAPEWFREGFQQELKGQLRSIQGLEILDFIGLEAGTATDVYDYDRRCTEEADLCVFIVDFASIGLGMEIVFRLMLGKPMLVFAKEDSRITRMLLGMCERETVPFHRYTTAEQISAVVAMVMEERQAAE